MIRRFLAAVVLAGGLLVNATPAGALVELPAAPTYLAGQFCKKMDLGKVVKADNGAMIKCVQDGSRTRWLVK